MIRYVTRWALTTGVRRVNGTYTEGGKYFKTDSMFVSAREAFEHLPDAIDHAKKMALDKSVRLRRQADALGSPSWEPRICE